MAGHTNHEANAAAWAAMRAEQEKQAEARREARRREKEARRAANRAAWAARRQTAAEPEQAPELAVSGLAVEQASAGEWHATAADGEGYMVECAGYTVTIGGMAYTVPTLDAARELIELAEETRRAEADEAGAFAAGMSAEVGSVTVTVEHATPTRARVSYETPDGARKVRTLMVRRDPERGQYVRLHANSKAQRDLYAAEMAA